MKTFYFFSVIEGDFFITAAISSLVKKYFGEKVVCKCLLPAHPKVNNQKLKNYYNLFDEVIELPFCEISRNIVSGYISSKKFKNNLNRIELEEHSYFFMFDVYTLPELIAYQLILKIKNKKNITLGFISTFERNLMKNNYKIIFINTILNTIYSILHGGKSIFWQYRIRNTEIKRIKKIKQRSDFQICIEKSKFISNAKAVYKGLPYPLPIIKYTKTNFINLSKRKSILVLVSSSHGKRWSNYWTKMDKIFDKIINLKDYNILVKDHPRANSEVQKHLKNYQFTLIDNSINAEQLYFDDTLNIHTVIGYGSTALITSSWLGLQTINYTKLLGYTQSVQDYYEDFLKLGNNIITLREPYELDEINISKCYRNLDDKILYIKSEWGNFINQLYPN